MRCKICDWEAGAPISLYHSTLAMSGKPSMWVDPETGESTCNCAQSDVDYTYESLSDVGNMEEGEVVEDD